MDRRSGLSRGLPLVVGLVIVLGLGAALRTVPQAGAKPHGPDPVFPLAGFTVTGDDNVVLQWSEQTNAAVRATPAAPTVVARAHGMIGTAMYDAWAAYDPIAVGTRPDGPAQRPAAENTIANKSKAISFAAYHVLSDLFPARSADFGALLRDLGYAVDGSDTSAPAEVGRQAAAVLLAYRHADGANQANGYADTSGYAPVNTPDRITDPEHWQPLRIPDGKGGFLVQKFATPHWGGVRPFALASGDQFRSLLDGPDLKRDKGYEQAAKDVVKTQEKLSDTDKAIAEYWADGPRSEFPPGHWCLFATFVSKRDHHTLDDDAKLFFAVGNAVMDAGITAWDAKRHWDFVRPITAVHYYFGGTTIKGWVPGQGIQKIDGNDWKPYQPVTVVTPPFPEYVSGHSTFSAAAAQVLRSFTGSDALNASATIRKGASIVEPGVTPAADVTLSWPTFSAAADQAGVSRRDGGIHFADGDLDGRKLGTEVGKAVWAKTQSYVNGTANN